AAADTFRAAAVEQLEVWADRIGADFHSKGLGADPAAVAFEAMDKALKGGYDIVFIDTAGRLHTKSNLMEELHKIRMVVERKHPGAPHRTVLVIDATTGQNALQQTKMFRDTSGVNEIILTKLDGTAKGGVALAVASQFGLPITFIGLGEKMEDLRPFDAHAFARALMGRD
ncbi:MAG: signal recognition particle-docking protein FtsY, partial [Mailhella sp.]|nr:signal recognition particle-docking protein FtsY [Mailhella sp.]